METEDEVETFKDLVSKISTDIFKKATEKANALDRISRIWSDDSVRDYILNEQDNRVNLIKQIGHCVRLECHNNGTKLASNSKALKHTMFDIWYELSKIQMGDGTVNVKIDSFFDTITYLIRHNFDVWAERERSVWWKTLEISSLLIETYSLADVSHQKTKGLLRLCIEHLKRGVNLGQRKDQTFVAKLLLILVKDFRILQFSMDVQTLIESLKTLFVDNFTWDPMNQARTFILDIVCHFFVGFAHSYREILLEAFAPLFRHLFPHATINERKSIHMGETGDGVTEPCFNDGLIRFLEVFVATAYPKGHIEILNENKDVPVLIDYCAKHFKTIIDRQYSKNVQHYNRSPESVIPTAHLRFVARLFVLQHVLTVRSGGSPEKNVKRPRIETCLEGMVGSPKLHYLVILEEIFDRFELLLSEDISTIVKTVVQLDLAPIRKHGGNMNTYVRALAKILRHNRPMLTDKELKTLFSKTLNYIYIPSVLESSCLLIENMLGWLLIRFDSKTITSMFDSTLKNICRLTCLGQNTVNLLLFVVRNHDFDELWTFKEEVDEDNNSPWKFRQELIMVLIKHTTPDVDYSDLLLTLLFIYPNAIRLDKTHSFTADEIETIEEDLSWIVKNRGTKDKEDKNKEACVLSTATIHELVTFLVTQVDTHFSSDSIDQAKLPQLWRVFTLFHIKSTRLNSKKKFFPMEEIRQLQTNMDNALLEVADVSEEKDLMLLDLDGYWEFSSSTARQAIETALVNVESMQKFIAHWDVSKTSDQFLEKAIKSPRLADSSFVGKCLFKLIGGKGLTSKVRYLRLYGKYLNQKEYDQVTTNIRIDLDNETARLSEDSEHVKFLTQMFSREVILGANRNSVSLTNNLEFLVENSFVDLILLYLAPCSNNIDILLNWFSQKASEIARFTNQTAFFVQQVFKEMAAYKTINVFLTHIDPTVDEKIWYYMPNYNQFKEFIKFLSEFRGEARNWRELVDSRSFPNVLFALRQKIERVLNHSEYLHLALSLTLSTIASILLSLKVQAKQKRMNELLMLDLVAIGRYSCSKLLKFEVRDDSALSNLIHHWLDALNFAAKTLGADSIGFTALDLLHDHQKCFPQLWDSVLQSQLPFVMLYKLILLNPSTGEYPKSFDCAYEAFQKGTLEYQNHPVIKTQLFWHWLIVRTRTVGVEKKSVVSLQLLWILCPWLRPKLSQILCMYTEETIRTKRHKVVKRFLDTDDNKNIEFMASLLLYDHNELFKDDVTISLYASIYQFYPGTSYPHLRTQELVASDNYVSTFISECLVQKLPMCFTELQSFANVALSNQIFGIFAVTLMWRRLEVEKTHNTKVIFDVLDPVISHFDAKDGLTDHEILFLSALVEIFTYTDEMKPTTSWIRCLNKAGLFEEAFYYLKYLIDFNENSKRALFHIKYADGSSFIKTINQQELVNQIQEAYTDIVVGLKDELLSQGLPLSMQYNPSVRAFTAEQHYNYGIASALYQEVGRPFEASNALFHLGHKDFDLTNKDNYRYVINLSSWPAEESIELSHPKSTDNHNVTLYALFCLACRKKPYDLNVLWEGKLEEVRKVDVIYPNLLSECRDLKLVEGLELMKRSKERIHLPDGYDTGLASTFLLAGWKQPESDTTERAFDTFFDQLQQINLNRVVELREKSSFKRAQELVKILQQVIGQYAEYRSESACLEITRLHVSNNEHNAAKFLISRLLKEIRVEDSVTDQEKNERLRNKTMALLMAAELSSDQKAEENFSQALTVAISNRDTDPNNLYNCSLVYAKYAEKRYAELDDHTKSRHFLLQLEAVNPRNREFRMEQEEKIRCQKEYEIEQQNVEQIYKKRQKFLTKSAENFMTALSLSIEDESVVPRLVAMLIQNTDNKELIGLVTERLNSVPAEVWLPVQEILTSYLFDETKPIAKLVNLITVKLITNHPYHSIFKLYFHLFSTDAKRKKIITQIISACKKKNSKLEELINNTGAAHSMFREFGSANIDSCGLFEKLETNVYSMVKDAFKIQKGAKILKMVPIPTFEQPLNEPMEYSTSNMITFAHIENKVIKAGGISAPKVLKARGSDGSTHKIIFKGEDLRQDVLAQLLFQLSNIIIRNSQFRSKQLRSLRTYKVVPIDKSVGLIEWCGNTTSLHDYLVGADKRGGAHKDYQPAEDVFLARRQFSDRNNRNLLENFLDVCTKITPVFRYFFYSNFPNPHDFLKHIRFYTDSLALWSIVCYIVGLGDRHLNNILLDTSTAELVHIDLGMLFEYSKRALPIPEKVPFRLTRDLVDPILVEGINGRFKHVSVHALELFRENAQMIIGISSLILHDPISSFKIPEGAQRNMLAETAISRLQSKLEGRDLSVVSQTPEQQVTQLINDARSPLNLSGMFVGWMPFI